MFLIALGFRAKARSFVWFCWEVHEIGAILRTGRFSVDDVCLRSMCLLPRCLRYVPEITTTSCWCISFHVSGVRTFLFFLMGISQRNASIPAQFSQDLIQELPTVPNGKLERKQTHSSAMLIMSWNNSTILACVHKNPSAVCPYKWIH